MLVAGGGKTCTRIDVACAVGCVSGSSGHVRYSLTISPAWEAADGMKIQILVDGHIVNTQIVSEALYPVPPTLREAKRIALAAALEDGTVKISESLRATFRAFDLMGNPIDEDPWMPRI
jgi:hypothetical protein